MAIDLRDWLVVFRDTKTEQRIKIRAEAGNPVTAVDAAMRVLDARLLGRRAWLVMDSFASLILWPSALDGQAVARSCAPDPCRSLD